MDSVHCTIHYLQLAINDGVLDQSAVNRLVKICSAIASHLHKSSKAKEAFIARQMEVKGVVRSKCLDLFNYVPTRWNSIYLMFERFKTLKVVVQNFLSEPYDDKGTKIQYAGQDAKLSDQEFELITKILNLLRPFFNLTKNFSSNKVSLAAVLPSIIALRDFLEKANATHVGTLRGKLLDSVNSRFFSDKNILTTEAYTTPTLLHPKYRHVIEKCAPEHFEAAKQNLLSHLLKVSSQGDGDASSISSMGN